MEIPYTAISYHVYVDGQILEEVFRSEHRLQVKKGCAEVYVTAVRNDTDEPLESEPSETIEICRN